MKTLPQLGAKWALAPNEPVSPPTDISCYNQPAFRCQFCPDYKSQILVPTDNGDALPISLTDVVLNPNSTFTSTPAATAHDRPAPPVADSAPMSPGLTDPVPDHADDPD